MCFSFIVDVATHNLLHMVARRHDKIIMAPHACGTAICIEA
jgi:hypothetical protein